MFAYLFMKILLPVYFGSTVLIYTHTLLYNISGRTPLFFDMCYMSNMYIQFLYVILYCS
jgi:hypothetical protein